MSEKMVISDQDRFDVVWLRCNKQLGVKALAIRTGFSRHKVDIILREAGISSGRPKQPSMIRYKFLKTPKRCQTCRHMVSYSPCVMCSQKVTSVRIGAAG